jgi:type II secretory pathway pseudopilin PulG
MLGKLRHGEGGFTLVTVMGAMVVLALITVSAFAAVNGDAQQSGRDVARKQALAAAEAGVNQYLFGLNGDNNYWAKCTGVPAPNAVNDPWDGTGPDPRTWQNVPSAATQFTIELLPANGYSKCQTGPNVSDTVIDKGSRSIRIRVTGRAPTGNGGWTYRSVIAGLKREGFLDFLWFTDIESFDPLLYLVNADGRPTNPSIVTWAANQTSGCNRYYRAGRGNAQYNGKFANYPYEDFDTGCSEIQFAPQDVLAGPMHTNDELYPCGAPTFGRNLQDQIESGKGWRPACSGTNPNIKGTWRPNWATIGMPETNASLKQIAGASYTFSGRTQITLGTPAGKMTVANAAGSQTLDYPADGVIYVQNSGPCTPSSLTKPDYTLTALGTKPCGDAIVSGTYNQSLTIATENDIIATGNITHADGDDVMLGLIADGFIRVRHDASYSSPPADCTNAGGKVDREIQAAILTLKHSFMVDGWYCGVPLGTLTIDGVIAQKYRGPVGRGGNSPTNGYIKNYIYDPRLQFRAPPHFLDPVESAWRVWRYTEQQPARHQS